MDWARAIKRNHKALSRIVSGLIAMVGLAVDGTLTRLPKPLYLSALRILRPAESALRRLIVIAARGVVVKPQAARPIPAGLKRAKGGHSRVAFQLCDPRQRVALWYPKRPKPIPDHKLPRCWSPFKDPNISPVFQPEPEPWRAPPKDDSVDAKRLGRRLQAIKQALDDLPAQAKRLVRWQAKRERMKAPKFTSPLRQGPPPGHRKKPKENVDYVLKECHALARDVLREDSS
jgi:hypothetical protein